MIKASIENLSTQEQTDLRKWLAKGELELLKKVIRAKVQSAQVKGANEAMDANSFNSFGEKAFTSFIQAQRYEIALTVIQEVIDQKDGFSILKLS